MDVLNKIPVREQDAKVRATNFEEVCLGYNMEEAMAEASRCINCKNAQCVKGCPVAIDIPGFIQQVKEGNIENYYGEDAETAIKTIQDTDGRYDCYDIFCVEDWDIITPIQRESIFAGVASDEYLNLFDFF